MTPEEFHEKMLLISKDFGWDNEASHSKADDLMCELLVSLGYKDGVDIFVNMEKWYA